MNNSKKIVLAAGVFYPDVGGPAIHVMKIAERLANEGFVVTVVAYGENPPVENHKFKVLRVSRKHSKKLQWLIYTWYIFKESFNASLVYAFDPTAAGLPARIAALLLHKSFVIRIGGDPIWERIVETNKRFITIEKYYEQKYYTEDAPRLYKLIQWVIKGAKAVVVYNKNFKDFYHNNFGVPSEKIHIVKNPAFKREDANEVLSVEPAILFAGRFVSYKNLPLLLNAFDKVRAKICKGKLILIGDGPEKDSLLKIKEALKSKESIEFIDKLSQDKLFEYIRASAFSIAPALNEFNPNFILESLSFGKPVIISKGNGLSVDLPDMFLFDPFSQMELEERMTFLLDEANYASAVDIVKKLEMVQTWEKVTDFHVDLVNKTINR